MILYMHHDADRPHIIQNYDGHPVLWEQNGILSKIDEWHLGKGPLDYFSTAGRYPFSTYGFIEINNTE